MSENTKICPNCNHYIEKDSKFCPNCGAFVESYEKQNENLIHCPGCGNLVSKKAEMCPHCGHPFPENKKDVVNQMPIDNSGSPSGTGFFEIVFAIIFAIIIISFC